MQLSFLLYTSRCRLERLHLDDLDILRVALRMNAVFGITGFLRKTDSHYIQYVEGPENHIRQLEENLRNDNRHREFSPKAVGPATCRRFADWSMGYSKQSDRLSGLPWIDLTDPPERMIEVLVQDSQMQRDRMMEA